TPAIRALAALLLKHKVETVAVEVLDLALKQDPGQPGLLADRAIAARDHPEEELLKIAATLAERAPEEALRVGQELYRRSKYPLAVEVYERILARHPGSATTWQALGSARELQKEPGKAREAYDKAFQLDPLNASIKKDRDAFE